MSLDAAQNRAKSIRIKSKIDQQANDFKSLNEFYERKGASYGYQHEPTAASAISETQRYYAMQQHNQSATSAGGSARQTSKTKNKMNNYLYKAQNSVPQKDRLQSTQMVVKKSAKVSKTGSIVLPANNTVQIVPQLRPQGGKQMAAPGGGNYTAGQHHRMYSDDQMQLQSNLQKGFNSASNAVLQNQHMINIYHQPNLN